MAEGSKTFAELAADVSVAIGVVRSRIIEAEDLARRVGVPKVSTDLALQPLHDVAGGLEEVRAIIKDLCEYEPELRAMLISVAAPEVRERAAVRLLAGVAR